MIKDFKLKIEFIWLSLILLLSAILNFWNLGIEGYANTYYAAGVKSMLMNFKNFFFLASDPSGFVSIDKPPLGFWLQTISAKIFGFSGWSIILPQALASVFSVALLYYLVKKSFGSFAGLIAALCLTVTPIFVAASRNNTIDNQLVLCMLLACCFLLTAAEKGNLTRLIISLAIIGIGFNIKMGEVFLVAPAIYITYFFSSSATFKKKTQHLIAGSAVLILISLSWASIVDLVPASSRPFVGSSTHNSMIELIVGYNGLKRVGLGNRATNNLTNGQNVISNNTNSSSNDGGGFGMGYSSRASIGRLFSNNNISDQVSWILPFALLGFIASALKENLKYPFDNKKKLSLLLWFLWLIPEFIYFSFSSGNFHTYYLTTMAPPIAALAGIGLSDMWFQYNEGGWKSWLLPIAFIVNGIVEIIILSYNYNKNSYRLLIFIVAILCFSVSILLCLLNFYKYSTSAKTSENINTNNLKHLKKSFVAVAFTGLLITPSVWSFTPLFYKMNGGSPFAGLELSSISQKGTTASNSKLISFLKTNNSTEKYLIAVPSAENYASDLILESGEPVMTIGGFSGSDKIITLEQFKELINKGLLRYVLVSEDTPYLQNSGKDFNSWIKTNGKIVPSSNWQVPMTSGNINSSDQRVVQLYDLNSAAK